MGFPLLLNTMGLREKVSGMLFPSDVVMRLNRLLTRELTSREDFSLVSTSNLGVLSSLEDFSLVSTSNLGGDWKKELPLGGRGLKDGVAAPRPGSWTA